jgi:plasmid stabilization system protein ParE
MTIEQLAARLLAHADCHTHVQQQDDEQRQWATDLRTAAAELVQMHEHLNRLRDERGQAQAELAKVRADLGAVFAQPAADAEGWIDWRGGECPVEPYQPVGVEVILRDGTHQRSLANWFRWGHSEPNSSWHACDIVRYRVVKG